MGDDGPNAIGVTWRYREKPQPEGAKFKFRRSTRPTSTARGCSV
jgi:hypothetical protein